jgi:2-phosphoglycerate kinase
MQLSKRKISKAYFYKEHPSEFASMKKYALIEELKEYGVSIDSNSDLDTTTLRTIMLVVLNRVVEKYDKEVIK